MHEFDNCRFDVNVGDCVYYLRAGDPTEKQNWVEILESAKVNFFHNNIFIIIIQYVVWTEFALCMLSECKYSQLMIPSLMLWACCWFKKNTEM